VCVTVRDRVPRSRDLHGAEGVQIISVSNPKEIPWWAWQVIFPMGLDFVAVGGSLVFGRRWTTLDSGKGIVVKPWGLLVPMSHFPA
jgi:hypothetical protein